MAGMREPQQIITTKDSSCEEPEDGLTKYQARKVAEIKASNPALYEKYAVLTDAEIIEACKVEREAEKCKGCTGLTPKCNGNYPVISIETIGTTPNALAIRMRACEYLQARRKQAQIARQFSMSKIPPKYMNKSWADYEVTADNETAVRIARKLESGLWLSGKPGTGKTFLAALTARELISKGKSVIFGDVPSLLDDLKATFDKKNENRLEELMKSLATVDMLILDDLGTESPTEWAVERLYLIVNERYNVDRPVIVTSNYSPDEVRVRLNNPKDKKSYGESVTGDRIVSRLRQMCIGVMLKGVDRRRCG